jgi:hypothetical protein
MAMMQRRFAQRLAVPLFVALVHAVAKQQDFEPFADVHELRPHSLKGYCGPKDQNTRLAKCQHAFYKRLDDDGDVDLSWYMELDPDQIISLDTDDCDVKLLKCSPGSLVMEFPKACADQARTNAVIVGSRFAHSCKHLTKEKHLAGKVTNVKRLVWNEDRTMARAHLDVTELHNIADIAHAASHGLGHLSFNFSWMPAEARSDAEYPEIKTNFGPYKFEPGVIGGTTKRSRRLDDYNLKYDYGSPTNSSDVDYDLDSNQGLLKFKPKQLSNFGWNWDFYMNSTSNPDFKFTAPGLSGEIQLRKPFIKMHAGIFLNFTSNFHGGMVTGSTPKVNWAAGMRGNGVINARLRTEMRTTGAASEDPAHLFDVVPLEKFRQTTWLSKVDLAMGALPVAIEPGLQFKVEVYHTGDFDGTLQIGGKTHITHFWPYLIYDSHKGMKVKVTADFEDTELYPPLWIVSADKFEMGIMLEPILWIKGSFGPNMPSGSPDAKMGMELRPYLNMSIVREKTNVVTDTQKQLIVYPFVARGIDGVDFNKFYQIKIDANNRTMSSSSELNWGNVDVADHMSKFNAGVTTQENILSKPIKVTLEQITTSGGSTDTKAVGSGSFTCQTLLNGVCSPDPQVLTIPVSGNSKPVEVELAVLWQANPVPWFSSRIRGVSMSFPTTDLNSGAEKVIPELADGGTPKQPMYLRVTHAKKTFAVAIQCNGKVCSAGSAVSFGPTFLQSWKPCTASSTSGTCSQGKVELYYGGTLIGSSDTPEIPWDQSLTDLEGEQQTEYGIGKMFGDNAIVKHSMQQMLSSGAGTQKQAAKIPLSISLKAADTSISTPIAIIHAEVLALDAAASSEWVVPSKPEQVALGTPKTYSWTIDYVNKETTYKFTLTTYKLMGSAATTSEAQASAVKFPAVGDIPLEPLGAAVAVDTKCTSTSGELGDQTTGTSSAGPCEFSHSFNFGAAQGFTVGDKIAIMVEWSDGATNHQMLSPPIFIVSSVTASTNTQRRLRDMSKPLACDKKEVSPYRRLWDENDWNQRLAANSESCEKEDMHFDITYGVMARAKMVDELASSMFMPMVSSQMPMMSTGFQRLSQNEMVDDDADKLLPDWLCSDGVCSGKMPGCTKKFKKPMHFQKFIFHFNRVFSFDDLDEGYKSIKTPLAYAFSTLPEWVEVFVAELNASLGGLDASNMANAPSFNLNNFFTQTTTSFTPAPQIHTLSPPLSPLSYTPPPPAFSSTPLPFFSSTPPLPQLPTVPLPNIPPVAAPGLTGTRRLRSKGNDAGAKRHLVGNKVTMTFKHGVDFKFDRSVIEMMLRHHMFDFDDDISMKDRRHPPLFITDFEIEPGVDFYEGGEDDFGQDIAKHAHSMVVASLLLLAIALSMLLIARWQASWKGTSKGVPVAQGADSEIDRCHLPLE